MPWRPEYAVDFDRLGREWLERYFTVEPLDEEYLQDPQGKIVDPGGQVFFAIEDGAVIGTCSAIPQGDGSFELAKLAVTERAQGRGLGRRLAERVLAFAVAAGAPRVTLSSSSRLGPALRLYESLGFEHQPFPGPRPYTDADVYMVRGLVDGAIPDQSANPAHPPVRPG
ncbi:MAG: GNAT family N-acetyltransferase [Cytophagaceae bacterium]|nr:GNAT family N-acetyltransferase [Gemmatimonadaceae bacterium]